MLGEILRGHRCNSVKDGFVIRLSRCQGQVEVMWYRGANTLLLEEGKCDE